jgi:dihydrofolate synthase/folylpolyglutamate synthase
MALRYFKEQKCDLVIWETGLGGRLDATNIVTPLASVITNVSLDHEQWLGDTLKKIAAEKAGIIKPGVPVITAADAPEAIDMIQSVADGAGSPLTVLEQLAAGKWLAGAGALPLFGEHQQVNAALAVATVATLHDQLPVTDEHIRRGLVTVEWPGRFQILQRPNGNTFVLDGAHNPAGAQALRDAMATKFPGARPTLVLGVLKDKDQSAICSILAPLAGRILLTPVKSERTAPPERLNELCAAAGAVAQCETCESLAGALEKAARDPLVLVTGSLYLIGEAMELLEQPDAKVANERVLNEWSQTK